MTFWVAGAVVGSSLIGGAISSSGQRQAASTQADTAAQSMALQKQMYDEQVARNQPFAQAGLTAQNRMLDYLGLSNNTGQAGYGKYARDFGMQDFQQDPGYQFRLGEGLKALDRQAAARGGLISGAALKAAQGYGQDQASQEYTNAFNRYQTNRANQLNPLGSLMSSGQAAVNNQATAAGNYGAQGAAALQAAGQATAAGQLGVGNTWNNALNTGASAYQNQTNFNNWLNRSQQPLASNATYANNGWIG